MKGHQMNTISSLLKNLRNRTPVGTIEMFAGTTAPTDWLICDGAAVSRETFSALYTALGGASSPWGQGDGSTTFNLPDMRSRMPIGASTNYALNAKGGSEYIQAHTHGFTHPRVTGGSCTIGTSGGHTHYWNRAQTANAGTNRYSASGSDVSVSGDGAHTHTVPAHQHDVWGGSVNAVSGVTTGNAGNMPPYIGINFIIYAGTTAAS